MKLRDILKEVGKGVKVGKLMDDGVEDLGEFESVLIGPRTRYFIFGMGCYTNLKGIPNYWGSQDYIDDMRRIEESIRDQNAARSDSMICVFYGKGSYEMTNLVFLED